MDSQGWGLKPVWVADFAKDYKVCQFIEGGGSNKWKEEEVRQAFHNDDAELILGIPLPRFDTNDKLIWHYSGNGCYNVKSGYEAALAIRKRGEMGTRSEGEGSNRGRQKEIWKSSYGNAFMT